MKRQQTLFFIHGRTFKPNYNDLKQLWIEALKYGIARDYGCQHAQRLDKIKTEFVYFGDLSNEFLAARSKKYNRVADTKARRITLEDLKEYACSDYTKTTYKALRSRFHPVRWCFAWLLARVPLVSRVAMWIKMPDMSHYWWNSQKCFGRRIRERIAAPLYKSLKRGDDVMLVGHSLGSIVAYDALSELSTSGLEDGVEVSRLVTLGSPLGVGFVKRRLRNWRSKQFPCNVCYWDNVAAEDDYVSLDKEVMDDFKAKMRTTIIQDWKIYNLAVKGGSAHQHHATGYLIHPKVAEIVNAWISSPST